MRSGEKVLWGEKERESNGETLQQNWTFQRIKHVGVGNNNFFRTGEAACRYFGIFLGRFI